MTEITEIVLEKCVVDINDMIKTNNESWVSMSSKQVINKLQTLKRRFDELITLETENNEKFKNVAMGFKIIEEEKV